jgi:hypothetical protein
MEHLPSAIVERELVLGFRLSLRSLFGWGGLASGFGG